MQKEGKNLGEISVVGKMLLFMVFQITKFRGYLILLTSLCLFSLGTASMG